MQAEKAERVPPGGSGEEAHKDKVLATFLGSSECVASPRLSWELGDGEGGWGQWHSSPLQPVPQFSWCVSGSNSTGNVMSDLEFGDSP